MAGVLDEPYSELIPLSGVSIQALSLHRLEPCPSYVAWGGRYVYSAELAWLSKVRLKLLLWDSGLGERKSRVLNETSCIVPTCILYTVQVRVWRTLILADLSSHWQLDKFGQKTTENF